MTKNRIDPDLKNIVTAKVESYDDDFELIIGGNKAMNREELLKNIEDETEIGMQIVEIQSTFLKDLINGNIYKAISGVV